MSREIDFCDFFFVDISSEELEDWLHDFEAKFASTISGASTTKKRLDATIRLMKAQIIKTYGYPPVISIQNRPRGKIYTFTFGKTRGRYDLSFQITEF